MAVRHAVRSPGPVTRAVGGGLPARVLPAFPGAASRAARVLGRNLLVSRRGWVVILSGFFEPVFYLLAIGVGMNDLVGDVTTAGGGSVRYAAFVAPALLAASAMNGAVSESTFNFFFKLRQAKVYDAMLATPVSVVDVARGEIAWCLLRGAIYAAGFVVVMAVMGMLSSWWAVLLLPAALLIGFAFAAVGMACTTYMRTWQDFDLIQLVILPLFLFSGTFYPLAAYPAAIRVVVHVTPLYQAVQLCRDLALGTFDAGIVIPIAYLAAMGLAGLAVVSRRLERLLLR
jgi:lipooligosaccharide transport system permease protein